MIFDFRRDGLMRISHLRLKWLWLGIGALLVAAAFTASLVSIPASLKAFVLHDKLAHVLLYGVLMGWFAQIFRHDLTRLLFVSGFVLMGIVIEYLQAMTPYRQFDVLDMVANSCGVLLAWALAYTWVGRMLEWVESLFLHRS